MVGRVEAPSSVAGGGAFAAACARAVAATADRDGAIEEVARCGVDMGAPAALGPGAITASTAAAGRPVMAAIVEGGGLGETGSFGAGALNAAALPFD